MNYYIVIYEGNNEFVYIITVSAHTFDGAYTKAKNQFQAIQKLTLEKIDITTIDKEN